MDFSVIEPTSKLQIYNVEKSTKRKSSTLLVKICSDTFILKMDFNVIEPTSQLQIYDVEKNTKRKSGKLLVKICMQ